MFFSFRARVHVYRGAVDRVTDRTMDEHEGRKFNVFVQFIPDALFHDKKCAPVPSAALDRVRQRAFDQAAYMQAYAADESDDAQEPDGPASLDVCAGCGCATSSHHAACALRKASAGRAKRSWCGTCGGAEDATGRKRGTAARVEEEQGGQRAPLLLAEARTQDDPPEEAWQAWQGSQPMS